MRPGVTIFTICCLFSVIHARGQTQMNNYSFRHITQLDGLINNNVFAITQDNRGFIWIGTQNGLQRYDGQRFVNYQGELNKENKSVLAVSAIDFVQPNHIFLPTHKKIDLQTNIVTTYSKKDLLKEIKDTNVAYPGPDSTTWIFSGTHVYVYRGDSIGGVVSPTEDKINNHIWVASMSGVYLMDGNTKKVYSKKCNPINDPLLLQSPSSAKIVFIDSRRNLWITTWNDDFYRYNLDTKKLTKYSVASILSQNHKKSSKILLTINDIFEDNHHQTWLTSSNGGMLLYNYDHDNFSSITHDNTGQGLQYNYETFCLFQDKDDNIWVGTDRGINIFNPYHQYFKVIKNEEGKEQSLPKREINVCIQTKNGDILVGTWGGGIVIYDHLWHFKKKINFTGPVERNLIWSFAEDDDGKIWMGCQHGYIHIYDPVKNSISTIRPAATQVSTIRCMQKDYEGNILFGLHNGRVAVWKKRENQFYAYNDTSKQAPGTFSEVHNIFVDNDGNHWVSTLNGLKLFDIDKRIFTAVYYPGNNKPNGCEGILEDNDSTLLVGIINGGYRAFNKITKTFSSPKSINKLSSSTVHAIKKDASGNVWFTTDYNLYKFIPQQDKYINYNMEPGMINSNFQSTNFYSLQDGSWSTATYTEIINFYPDTLNRKKTGSLSVEIAGLKLFDQSLFIDSFLFKKKPLVLSYKQNFLTIEFAALNFSNIRQIKYYYRLSGVDQDWVNGDVSGEANYTNLAPGNYTFYVMADDEGNKGKVSSFNFIITPPFWQTWWFRIGSILLIVCIIYWLVKRRIRAIRNESVLKQQIVESEMMALRAQMNPHFIFNCINSIDALIQSNDKYHATIYLNKFAKLIRNILDSSKQNTVTLAKDFETLRLYIELELLRNENKFVYELEADNSLMQDDYRVPPLIIQPYVENAILHGLRYRPDNKGRLFISISRQNGNLVYIVEDNGVGRHAPDHVQPKEKQSYGIEMSNERVKLFNKEEKASVEITDLKDNGAPAGTKVKVSLKIHNS